MSSKKNLFPNIIENDYLMSLWDWDKNNDIGLNPNLITGGSGKIANWICSKGHHWQAPIRKIYSGNGCPYCSGHRLLVGFNDLETCYPELAKQWHPTKNGDLTPKDVQKSSMNKVVWLCDKGHEWTTTINGRKYGNTGCPYCSSTKVCWDNCLANLKPDVAKLWHPTKNNTLTPNDVTWCSGKKVWWLGECSHEWESTVANIINGNGCPVCSNKKVLNNFNDLATINPNLAAEWHPTKNRNIFPTEVVADSNKKVWWLGKCGHEWMATIVNRNRLNRGCPYCAGKKVLVGFNDLATANINIARQWHPTKNKNLTPKDVTSGSRTYVYWLCEQCGFEWKAKISNRTILGRSCPQCAKERQTSFPEKAIYFYISKYFKNACENFTDTWLGKHELDIYIPELKVGIEYDGGKWHTNIDSDLAKNKLCFENDITLYRIRENCPILNDTSIDYTINDDNYITLNKAIKWLITQIVGNTSDQYFIDVTRDELKIENLIIHQKKQNSLKEKFPELSREWHPYKNGNLNPDQVTYGSGKKVWWLGKCGHEWIASIYKRTSRKNIGCPICSGQQILIGFNDLATTHPNLVKEWHPYKNTAIGPKDVSRGSQKKIWWKCNKCGFEWEDTVSHRTNGRSCRQCRKILRSKKTNNI